MPSDYELANIAHGILAGEYEELPDGTLLIDGVHYRIEACAGCMRCTEGEL